MRFCKNKKNKYIYIFTLEDKKNRRLIIQFSDLWNRIIKPSILNNVDDNGIYYVMIIILYKILYFIFNIVNV